MFTDKVMSLPQSLIISALGLAVVFACLIILAYAIKIVAGIVAAAAKKSNANKPSPAAKASAAPAGGLDDESKAAMIAALCEEMKVSPEKLTVNSIKAL